VLVVVVDVEVARVGLERLELLYPLLEGDLGNGVRQAGAAGPTPILRPLELEADGPELRDALGVELRRRPLFERWIFVGKDDGDDENYKN
jgi:hypothetical protein